MRNIKWILFLLLLILIVVLLIVYRGTIVAIIKPEKIQRTTITVLKNEKMAFLVTNRLVTQVVVEEKKVLPGIGTRSGYLIGTVKVYYGIDLSRLTPESIEVKPQKVIVHLPSPSVLDYSVDLSSLRFFTRETGMMKVASMFMKNEDLRKELEERFYKEAIFFFKTNGLLPDIETIQSRLENFEYPIRKLIHLNVEFKIKGANLKLDSKH